MDETTTTTEALIRLLVYAPWNEATGREVVTELRRRGPTALAALRSAVMDATAPKLTRMVVATLLGESCQPDDKFALTRVSSDSDRDVADTARAALDRCEHLHRDGRDSLAH